MSINPFKTDSSTAKCRSDPNLSTLHALVLNSGIAFNCSLSFYLVVFMNVNSKTTDDTTYHVVEFIADPFADNITKYINDNVSDNYCGQRHRQHWRQGHLRHCRQWVGSICNHMVPLHYGCGIYLIKLLQSQTRSMLQQSINLCCSFFLKWRLIRPS